MLNPLKINIKIPAIKNNKSLPYAGLYFATDSYLTD
jgi:hypothetical protein